MDFSKDFEMKSKKSKRKFKPSCFFNWDKNWSRFCWRMFNKFRFVINELKDKIEQIQNTFLGWLTRWVTRSISNVYWTNLFLQELKDTAVGSSKYKCILFGQ